MNSNQSPSWSARRACIRSAIPFVLLVATAGADSGFSFGVAAGDVTNSTAVVWTRADLPGRVGLELSTAELFDALDQGAEVEAGETRDNAVSFDLAGLQPQTTYYYRFTRADDATAVSRTGKFRTAPADNAQVALRFVFSGDTNFAYAPFGVVASLAAENADAFIWFGDTIYADASSGGLGVARTLDEYRAKYRQIRSDPSIRDALASGALITGGDDHEVANDYAGTDPALAQQQKLDAYQAFFEYMPIRPQGVADDAFRMYRRFRYGENVEMFVLDARQYREPSAAESCGGNPDPLGFILGNLARDADCEQRLREPRTMLGREQLDWLLSGLLETKAATKFIVNNVPMSFIGILPYDRWDGYDAERREILEFIHANQIQGVVILTTDIHANALNPDVSRYFRERRREYVLSPDVCVAEVIVGPLGNETLRGTLTGLGSTNLTAGLTPFSLGGSPIAGLLGFGELVLRSKLREVNHFAMVETDRVSYAVLDVAADGTWSVAYRGLRQVEAQNSELPAETFYDSASPQTASVPCGLPVLVGLGAGLVWSGRRK